MEPQLRTLFVHTAGTRLVLDGHSVKAIRDDSPPRRLPLEAIDTIVVTGGVDVSTPLLVHCAEEGRLIVFLSGYGRPRALVEGVLDGRSALRRQQYAAHADLERRRELAAAVVQGKLDQMGWALRQWARDAAVDVRAGLRADADSLATTNERIDEELPSRDELLGFEGEATRRYFAAMGTVLPKGAWLGRRRRPPTDPFNATLSWLYSLTRVAAHGGVVVAGLDTGTGFLHGDRPGQPSLVLDLMEELRPAADRLAVRLWKLKRLQDRHFERVLGGAVSLTTAGREVLFEAWHHHRASEVAVRGRAQAVTNGFVPIMQAHAMANAIRHGGPYVPHRRRVA